ncbi:MAG: DNA polymerase III subunit gamma/tau, partial [Lawsonibacter sp.]|nr:DNA polymerase III subunit gamma/tau [Lawsonibacter sp.]
MHYTALYRKYRPRFFGDLVGQQHIATTLRNALCQDRVVHAYLFCGPRGTGKTSTAHIMARAVNCLCPREDGEPCGHCEACDRILGGQSLDIIEIDAASNRGIDKMRDLRDGVKYTPAQEKYKVYIIDEVHMLTNEAFNALLKTLEEPPKHTIFILATTEPHQVLPTVLSRCQRFDFHRISQGDIIECLKGIAEKEHLLVSEEALQLIARRASGGLRDAIGLLDQCLTSGEGAVEAATVREILGSADDLIVRQLACAVSEQDTATMISLVDTLVNEGKDLRQILLQLLEYLREELLESLKPQGSSDIPRRRLLQMLRDLVDADMKMKESQSARITFELALLSAARLEEA